MELMSDQYARTNRAAVPEATWPCQPVEPADAQRDPVRGRTGLQVARPADAFRQLAHALHMDEPVVEERCARPGVRAVATGADGAHPGRGVRPGQHRQQGASRRHGALKETVHRPSASPGAAGTPDFMWLPRMPEQSLPSGSRPATHTTLRKGAGC